MARGPQPGKAWRGRMLGCTIADSKKLADVSERSALIYLLLLPRHDGEGFIPADSDSMLIGCARFGLAHLWRQDDMAEAREELAAAGLWHLVDGPRGLAAEYVGWEDHQRLDRIGRGSRLAPELPETSRNSAETPRNSAIGVRDTANNSASEVKRSGIEHEEKSKTKVARARVAGDVPGPDGAVGELLIVNGGPPTDWYVFGCGAYRIYLERRGKDPTIAPTFDQDFRDHARRGIFAKFETREALADRFLRDFTRLSKARDKDGKPYGTGPRALLNALYRDEDEHRDDEPTGDGPREALGQPIMPTMAEACPWILEEHPLDIAARRKAAKVPR